MNFPSLNKGQVASPKQTKIFFCGGDKKREWKGEKYLKKENIFFAQEKKNGKGKGGKYLENENILFAEDNEKGGKCLLNENI